MLLAVAVVSLFVVPATATATAAPGQPAAPYSCRVDRGGQVGWAIDCNAIWDIPWYHGRNETIVVGTDFKIYHTFQLTPGGAWSTWGVLQGGEANHSTIDVTVEMSPWPGTTSAKIRVYGTRPMNGSWYYCDLGNGSAWNGWHSC
ncbi:hypothetical protein [Amycolatopsis samaneae]|uniref:Secreted protein n=1 Tax=Amycolatopsis samaneae TaxID=664691 RepID=A0ABW5GQB8_9PSEU